MIGNSLTLADHPRLYLTPTRFAEVRSSSRAADRAVVAADADRFVTETDFDELPATHNAHLNRARRMQTRVVTLLAQWVVIGADRYRDAVMALVETIGRWEYWSWIAWRRRDSRPDAIFDLSYGENSATLALAYDGLYDTLDESERAKIVDIARRRSLQPFVKVLEGNRAWWFRKPNSNWNSVCAGGAGLLALALYDELAEARAALPLVESSLEPYMSALEKTEGGFPEGIGYWNYGMRYAFMYLLSHERATRKQHPLLRADATRATLSFPLDFCPYGLPCSFGDSNHWSPLPVHRSVADALGEPEVSQALESFEAPPNASGHSLWPDVAEAVLLAPSRKPTDAYARTTAGKAKSYRGLGWVRLADRWPDPQLYLAIRGGTTEVPHGHLDLLSFHAVVRGEQLVENLTPAEYLDTTFGTRRPELFEMAPRSKNVPLINGVGIVKGSTIEPELVEHDGNAGVRLDATDAMGGGREGEPLARSCVRLFVLFGAHGALILDRIDLRHAGRVEARLHTRAGVEAAGATAALIGRRERMSLTFAANRAFTLTTAPTVPTTPGDDATVIRWCGPKELDRSFVMATLLVPGEAPADLSIREIDEGWTVRVGSGAWSAELALDRDLRVGTALG